LWGFGISATKLVLDAGVGVNMFIFIRFLIGGLTTINMIVGFIPLYNALIAPTLYLTGSVGDVYMVLNIATTLLVIVIVFVKSQKYYKRGLLNYSNTKK
jgi:hypothetical protein